jgi:hypothetical protein
VAPDFRWPLAAKHGLVHELGGLGQQGAAGRRALLDHAGVPLRHLIPMVGLGEFVIERSR